MGGFIVFLAVVAIAGAVIGNGAISLIACIVSVICSLNVIITGEWLAIHGFASVMVLLTPIIAFVSTLSAFGQESARKDKEYLASLSPEERKKEIEVRTALYFHGLKEREQKRQHEEQLKRDLDIIDKHYEKQYRDKHMFD